MFVPERNQRRPANDTGRVDPLETTIPAVGPEVEAAAVRRLPVLRREWVRLASVADVPEDGGIAVRYGDAQIALFHFASRGEWYATQNMCPHKRQMVLARGILGSQGDAPKVACPLHKKTFDLRTGGCLSGESLAIATFPVRIQGGDVLVELPPVEELRTAACTGHSHDVERQTAAE
jgi:NAD(P)H-dependent nitrite reductase small subunit